MRKPCGIIKGRWASGLRPESGRYICLWRPALGYCHDMLFVFQARRTGLLFLSVKSVYVRPRLRRGSPSSVLMREKVFTRDPERNLESTLGRYIMRMRRKLPVRWAYIHVVWRFGLCFGFDACELNTSTSVKLFRMNQLHGHSLRLANSAATCIYAPVSSS